MKSAGKQILTINGGSSSIKFALFEVFEPEDGLRRILEGEIERIGLPDSCFRVKGFNPPKSPNFGTSPTSPISGTSGTWEDYFSRPAPDYAAAVDILMAWLNERRDALTAVGHRVVHGGSKYGEPQPITADMIEELHRLSRLAPEHLPGEILLIEAFHREFPTLPQAACFDTSFHRDMPRVARLLAIPRRFEALGARRYGFHGLSYAFLMEELAALAGEETAKGRIILAHLGNGASLAAVRDGKGIDTSMGFTPTSGLMMSTRSGDLDPGLLSFLADAEGMTAPQFQKMANHESGLLGVSETSSDMRDLLYREREDVRAAEAIALFCYQIEKCIGAFAAALGGLDALVFSGGIGENSPIVRERICDGLEFLGIELDENKNKSNDAVISKASGRVAVRVIRTDEEQMIAKQVCRVFGLA